MRNVYSVGQVNAYIKNMFSQDFMLQRIYVKGEASNVKYHTSGHLYFTLKDEKGTIACVMFAGSRKGLGFRLQDGQQIIVGGSVEVYERDGKYQLYAREIMLDGAGDLHEKFEKLKQELMEMGMFDESFKRPIPKYVERLGVVTAPTGAAVRDIIQIASRRNPYVQIILYPAQVQGEGAARSIANGIRALQEQQVDVMIVGRGGGSIEDLWAFNEELTARAIFECTVPVISAVGHETDTTIADFVADLRAPTPSAAAELAVYSYGEFSVRYQELHGMLYRLMQSKLMLSEKRLDKYRVQLNYLSPAGQLKQRRQYLMDLELRLTEKMNEKLHNSQHLLAIYIERLKGLSPVEKLNRGFGFVSDAAGTALTDVDKVSVGQQISIHLRNGRLTAEVRTKEKLERGNADGCVKEAAGTAGTEGRSE